MHVEIQCSESRRRLRQLTRSWSEAQSKTRELEKRLKDFAEGKVVPKGMTVEAVVQEWYEFRDPSDLDNTKAELMGGKLMEWCEKNNILLLSALTTDKVIKWASDAAVP